MIYSSTYPPVEIPRGDVYTEVLGSLTDEDLDRTAITDGAVDLTYRELRRQADAFAGALAARGIAPGDVIALQVPNSPEFAVAYYGILRAGATVTTLNTLYSVTEVAKQLQGSNAKAYITISPLLPTAHAAARHADIPPEAVIIADHSDRRTSLADLIERNHPVPEVAIDPSTALAALPYSSGTTGLAKGVMLTHRNLVANIAQSSVPIDVSRDDRVMAVLPFFHIYGMNTIMNLTLYRRGTLVTMPKMELPAFLDLVQRRRVTYLYIAPPIAVALAKHPIVDDYDLTSIRRILTGAAPLDEALGTALLQRIPAELMQGFGMTELSPLSHTTPIGDDSISIGSIGIAVPNIEFRVVDVDTGDDVPQAPGARTGPGEMLVRGPNVMLGYLGNAPATEATITPDGWLRTGDIVEVGPRHEVYVVDRLKELIKYKGYQVPPAELEALLLTHPAVADVAVVAHPDEEAGEIPRAFIVPQQGASASSEEIIDWVRSRIAPHKRIRMVDFISTIPKSAAGKILRKDLKALS
ncbi:AMP-binding protein [Tsukamurella sp. 1534]|uniref:AMP-binding protein n=1 Tax=Tsukamurella sp. 1534 TaxID=1151061 RepID=UPI00031C7412|nr:AMP-binding protein [Tsukamurella sp. 1534]